MGASQQARDRQTEGEVWGSADVCGFSYLSGKAPVLIVTGLSTASAPDKEGIEGTGRENQQAAQTSVLRTATSVSTLFMHRCVRLSDTTQINLESVIE